MMKKKNLLLVLGLGILIAVVGLFFLSKRGNQSEIQNEEELSLVEEKTTEEQDNELIGGNRDEHGCLGPAGYSYDEEIGACVRSWELNPEQRQMVQSAVDYLGKDNGLTVIKVEKKGDDNRDFVFFQKADLSQVKVEMNGNNIVRVYPIEADQLEASESATNGSGQ